MCSLEEFQAAILAIWNVAAGQLYLKMVRPIRGAHQDRLAPETQTALIVLKNLLHHEVGLILLPLTGDESRLEAIAFHRAQFLRMALRGEANDAIGGALNTSGYGQMRLNKRHTRVHRFAWMWFNGPIPDGLEVLHRCDNPACLNPKHLFLGTQGDNNRDCVKKGRHNSPRGEKHWNTKLTEWDVKEIRRRTDMPTVALAKAFMVCAQVIRGIKARTAWKHVV